MNKCLYKSIIALLLFLTAMITAPTKKASAETKATAITIGTIDYDNLTMIIYTNNNSIVYLSTDKKTWFEVEGDRVLDNTAYQMDISWISSTADKTLYFKGDLDTTVIPVTLPAKDNTIKVTYNKADGDFTFTNCDNAESFQWRKATDYHWYDVSMNPSSQDYKDFMNTVDNMLVKGAKIIIRIPQTRGEDAVNTGERPSKEVTVVLTKRANAPSVSVNASKLTLNTTTKMEYYNEQADIWVECDKSMSVEDIAPSTLFQNGAKTVTLQIRTAATASKTYSKSTFLTITGQADAPIISGQSSEIAYYYENNKLCLVFKNASKTNIYSYCIVKPDADFDVAKVTWKQVKDTNVKKLSQSIAPDGSVIYIRKQGTDQNDSKGISLVLSSKEAELTVKYPSTESSK